ncbi:hypothetical protein ACFL1X_06630 [Candidatus Hydrogenedentota bacterium]
MFEHRGPWAWHPNLLEPMTGPWFGYEKYGNNPVETWKLYIDWLAERDVNLLIAGISPTGIVNSYHDWCYHWVLDFDKFPEASCFSKEFVAENRAMLKEILGHARSRGITPYIHNYNFGATKNFVLAHEEVLQKAAGRNEDGSLTFRRHVDQTAYVVGCVCWNEPAYKEFMKSCWREIFEHFPELGGILVTPGEYANCCCKDCANLNTNWHLRLRRMERMNTLVDFVETFTETLHDCDKTPLVRLWAGGESMEWAKRMPKGVPYVFKYSGFDCCDCDCDPVVKAWNDEGHETWISKEYSGGENAGPIVWADEDFTKRVVDESEKTGSTGLIYIDNTDHGSFGMPYVTQWANPIALAHHASGKEGDALPQYFDELFGDKGQDVLDAVKLYSEVVLNTNRILWAPGEGFMWTYAYGILPLERTASILGKHCRIPDWLADGVLPLDQIVHHLDYTPWTEDLIKELAEKDDVISLLERTTESARKGLESLRGLACDISEDAAKEFKLLLTSASLAYYTGVTWTHLVRACVYYYAVKSPLKEIDTQRKLAEDCLAELQGGIDGYKMIVESLTRLPRDMFKPECTFVKGPARMRTPVNNLVFHWERQRDAIAREFAELIEGEIWML